MATIGRKLLSKSEGLPPRPVMPVPALTVSEDRAAPFLSGYDPFDPETRWTDIYRGPVLRIISPSMELLMNYKNKKEMPDDDDTEGLFQPPAKNNPDNEYTCEATEPFVANTPQCKQTRLVVLKNEGTTTIRYQWLRFPPSKAMRTMLANPRHFLNLDTPGNCNEQDKPASASDSSSTSISGLSDGTYTNEERRNAEFEKVKDIIGRKPNFLREASFDFHFREMPGILLPGQTIEMPIVYHPRQAGYCHENLYLLTHPRVSDESDKTYMVRLTGFCMDSDWAGAQPEDHAVTGNEMQDPESVKRTMNKTMLELLSADLIDSVLDHALYKKINQSVCTLPTGKVTPECIFHTHNPHLHYHYGVAERAIETAQKLNNILIPGYNSKMETRNLCPLSIKNLYYMLWDNNGEDNKSASLLRTTRTEKLLRRLTKCNKILSRPPIFAYANAGSREHTGCQVYLTAVFDEILERMDIIKETFEESPMYKIQRGKLEDKYRQKLLRDHYRTRRRNERTKEREQVNTEFETGQTAPDPQLEEKRVSFNEDGKAEPPIGAKTIEDEKEISENVVADTEVHTAETEIRPEISPVEQDYDESGKEVETDVEEIMDIEAARVEKKKRKKSRDDKSAVSEKVLEGGAKKNTTKKTKESKKKKGDKVEKQDKEKQKSETLKEAKSAKGSMEERKLNILLEIPGEMEHYDYPEELPPTTFSIDKTSAEEIFESVELEVGEMLRKRTETKLKQARLIAFEHMIGVGIERMMSIVDTMKNVYDYKSPDFFGQNPPREQF